MYTEPGVEVAKSATDFALLIEWEQEKLTITTTMK